MLAPTGAQYEGACSLPWALLSYLWVFLVGLKLSGNDYEGHLYLAAVAGRAGKCASSLI